ETLGLAHGGPRRNACGLNWIPRTPIRPGWTPGRPRAGGLAMAEIAVGIDLGTSNSCVAVARGGRVEVLPNSYGEPVTASVVHFAKDGTVLVGNTARAALIHDPHNTVASSKRLIGRYSFSEEVKKARAVYSYEIVDGPGHSVRVKIRDELFSLPE